MGAISIKDKKAVIDLDECVECSVCRRSGVCPKNALEMQELDEMRKIRHQFSDPKATHPSTMIKGRGTEEIKTNDVTNRVACGRLGFGIEVGRPGIGTRFYDVQRITKALAPIGLDWEKANPLTSLIANLETGEFMHQVLNEKVLSCIIEFSVPVEKLEPIIKALLNVQHEVETVFSVSMISTYDADRKLPGLEELKKIGITPRPNAKTNLGMGKPGAQTKLH